MLGLGRRSGQQRTISVSGALTASKRKRLLAQMHLLAERQKAPITVDLSDLSSFDSDSLIILLGTERIIERQLGCEVDIRGLDVAAQRVTGVTPDLLAS